MISGVFYVPVYTTMDSSTVDRDFLEARAALISLAAYFDRVDRHGGADDYRHQALLKALAILSEPGCSARRAREVLVALSDPSTQPIPAATIQGAFGAPAPTA